MTTQLISRALVFSFGAVAALGCAGVRAPAAQRPVELPSDLTGGKTETVYFGSVFPLDKPGKEPLYVYERRVGSEHGQPVAAHITRDASGATILADSATHAPDYRLIDYTLHTNQLGQSGSIHVGRDEVSFRLDEGGRQRTRSEKASAPVVVGPTLVGYIFRNLDQLRAGQVLPVRFAVLDRLETIGFQLDAVPAPTGQTRIRMRASSFLLAALIDPVTFTFESDTGKLVRLEGRVPSKIRCGDRLRDLDARVEYRFVAAAYR
jgi:hypothetical protein